MKKLMLKVLKIKINADALQLKIIGLMMHPETFTELVTDPMIKNYMHLSYGYPPNTLIVQKVLGFPVEVDPKIPKDNIRAIIDTSDWE